MSMMTLLALIWTFLVVLLTLLMDVMSAHLLLPQAAIQEIKQILGRRVNGASKLSEIRRVIRNVLSELNIAPLVGVDLAKVSLTFNFTILGLWIQKTDAFPSLQFLNSKTEDRQVIVWIGLFLLYLLLLAIAVHWKRLYMMSPPPGRVIPRNAWQRWRIVRLLLQLRSSRNRLWLANNVLGFLMICASIILFTAK